MKIDVATDFSMTPGPRFKRLGPHSGEEFREAIMRALSRHPDEEIEVFLDGTEGYGSSFLEEAFGGIVRHSGFPAAEIRRRLHIRARSRLYESYAEEAQNYLNEALLAREVISSS